MATTIYAELDKLINRKTPRSIVAGNIEQLGLGRYMLGRWISMTSAKNAAVMSMFNFYGGVDDVDGICGVAALFGGRYGKFSYLKKTKTRVAAATADDPDVWPERFSKREVSRIAAELEWYKNIDKENRKRVSNGKKVKDA